jgi:hypothetical protein
MMENWEKELEKYINSKEHKYITVLLIPKVRNVV